MRKASASAPPNCRSVLRTGPTVLDELFEISFAFIWTSCSKLLSARAGVSIIRNMKTSLKSVNLCKIVNPRCLNESGDMGHVAGQGLMDRSFKFSSWISTVYRCLSQCCTSHTLRLTNQTLAALTLAENQSMHLQALPMFD